MGLAHLMLVALSAAPSPHPAPAPLTPAAIAAEVEQKGAGAVLEQLAGSERRWAAVLAGVASGHKDWLRVAQSLKPAASSAASLELTVAVSRALEKAPANVLAVLDAVFDADDVCSLNTIEDTLGPSYTTALHTVQARERAVAAVKEPALADRRNACLSFLKELEEDVRRNRAEWFEAR